MKNALKVAFVYIGLVIGAGFASGREIIEYFNEKSRSSVYPVLISAFLFSLCAFLILRKAQKHRTADFGKFVEITAGRLAPFIKVLMLLFMFCGFFVMLSASGSLFYSCFGLDRRLGSLALAAVCFLVFSFDISGIVAVNAVLVPFMIFGIAYLSVSSLLYGTESVAAFKVAKSAAAGAVCYVSYNTITAGAVLVPLSPLLDKKSTAFGACLAGITLGGLIFLIRAALNAVYDRVLFSDMPLLSAAALRGEIYSVIYAAVLYTSICTTAVSHGFGILSQLHLEERKSKVLAAGIFCLAALPFSDLNFSFLISSLYSVFGYFGLIWLFVLILRK